MLGLSQAIFATLTRLAYPRASCDNFSRTDIGPSKKGLLSEKRYREQVRIASSLAYFLIRLGS